MVLVEDLFFLRNNLDSNNNNIFYNFINTQLVTNSQLYPIDKNIKYIIKLEWDKNIKFFFNGSKINN